MLPEQAREVKSLLIQKGITQKRVAEIAGVQTSVVSSVINGRFRSYKVEKVIAEITGYEFPQFERVPRSLTANS